MTGVGLDTKSVSHSMHKQWLDGPALMIISDLTVMMARSVHAQQWELRRDETGKGMGKKARGNQPGRLLAVDQVPPHV
jgi:hypothetical protein